MIRVAPCLGRWGLPLAALLTANPLAAQAPAFSGRASVGVRSVDLDGSRSKFREDIDLSSGARLFEMGFTLLPGERYGRLADRVDLDVRNLGGDPFRTMRFSVRKFGAFNFRFDRRGSDYFYDDVILPPGLADVSRVSAGDFHRFDFERLRDTAQLTVDLSPAARFDFGMERFGKTGSSTTTRSVQRDEFQLDQPIDEGLNAYRAGFSYAWRNVTLMLEERIRDFDNGTELFLPASSQGADPDDPSALDVFSVDQFYGYRAREHFARLTARPSARIELSFSALLQDLDLDMRRREVSEGTGFSGIPFASDISGSAEIARDSEYFDFDLTYHVSERLRIISGLRRRQLDQGGDVQFDGEADGSVWDNELTGFDAGLTLLVKSDLTLTVGGSYESRKTLLEHDGGEGIEPEDRDTERDGLFFRAAYTPSRRVRLTASVDENNIQAPFTLASPSDSRRFRLQARYAWDNGVALRASYRSTDLSNGPADWSAESTSADVGVLYVDDRLELSLGYTRLESGRKVAQLVTGGTRQELFPVAFEAESDFVNGSVRLTFEDWVAVGGRFRLFQNAGSFPRSRDDLSGFVELGFGSNYFLGLSYRLIDYVEDGFDDYDARILEVSIGYR